MDECLLKMLVIWFESTNPPPTWKILTEALESPSVGKNRLAEELRNKYCSGTEVGVTHSDLTQQPVLPGALPISQGT